MFDFLGRWVVMTGIGLVALVLLALTVHMATADAIRRAQPFVCFEMDADA